MNKTEIKAQVKDIIKNTGYTIQNLKEKSAWLDEAVSKIRGLKEHLEETEMEDVFEYDELEEVIRHNLLMREFEEIFEATEELIEAIDAYADGLSETKANEIRERYEGLECVADRFNQSNRSDRTIDMAIEDLEDAMDALNEMLK